MPKVLLVDDDPVSLFALESLLAPASETHHYQLITATSGKGALREILRHEFAVVLLDVSMPGMDGFETAEAIRSHPRSASVPIVFITAHYADETNRLKSYRAGAADYLHAPIVPQILQAKVAVFVDIASKAMLLRAQAKELVRQNQALRVQRLQDLARVNADLDQEVAERKAAEQYAHELATQDGLTRLMNRRALVLHLEQAIALADRNGGQFALLLVNLDSFRQFNHASGHDAGDELLRQVAARLSAAVRVADLVARLGGDEFAVLLESQPGQAGPASGAAPGVPAPLHAESASATHAARVAAKIGQACGHPFDIGGRRVKVGAGIGVALYPRDGRATSALLRHADLAMRQARLPPHPPEQ